MTNDPAPDAIRDLSPGEDCLVFSVLYPNTRPEELFSYWTCPELLERWWAPVAEVEPKLNGSYHLSWPAGPWHLRGTYTAWDPGRKLGFTWKWDHDPDDTPTLHVEVMLNRHDCGTDLTLVHGLYSASDRDRQARSEHRDGWTHFLGRLLAAGAASQPAHAND